MAIRSIKRSSVTTGIITPPCIIDGLEFVSIELIFDLRSYGT